MSHSRLRNLLLTCAFALGVCTAAVPPTAAVATETTASSPSSLTVVGPFSEPGFAAACTWHTFGEGEQPPWWLAFADPLCVEYSKRDITLDNGGALKFLLAEPSRIAASLVTCRYYQKDHWSVQSTPGAVPWVTWDGQYWWDKQRQRAGIRLANFRINKNPVGIGDAAIALRPLYPDLADALAAYGNSSGESGLTATLPFDLRCALGG
ncbi:hypothetical protein [Streptomyces sp. NPDC048266]|uniref:hypothetical protein n=1 Tax=Streptomyces sp. NPDC048266 TaxID=3155787 RepID=UPI0033DCD6E8